MGVGVVGLAAPGSWLFAGVRGEIEPGRERVEDWRERAVEVRREPAGEGGAGRDEESEPREERNELRRDLRLSCGGLVVSSVTVVATKGEGVVVMQSSAADGSW